MKFTLRDLEKRIAARASASDKISAKTSYTRALLDKGVGHCGKKLREEARETAHAATDESRKRVAAEAADLLYHLLVLMKARGVALADVEAELARRTVQSGHAEKASRRRRRTGK
jgi:phosphoribosyl-ATP pyrophosphohydrolase